jgi:hypothetical protein
MLGLILPFLSKYLNYIKYGALALSYLAVAWGVHHFDTLSYEAERAKHIENIANSIPEVITKTQVITRILHDSKDKCADTAMPPALIEQLH